MAMWLGNLTVLMPDEIERLAKADNQLGIFVNK